LTATSSGAGGYRAARYGPATRAALAGPVLQVAPRLLGAVVWHGAVAVRLTEVEAYDGANDPGSHAYRGPTARNQVMFGPPGHLYVYFTYGMHHCMNVVCGEVGTASGILLRAGEVVAGQEIARERRAGVTERDWARGPARLCRTLDVDRSFDGADLCDPQGPVRLELLRRPAARAAVATGPRVGVAGEGGDGTRFPWRFWLADEPTVSVYRPAVARRRSPPPG